MAVKTKKTKKSPQMKFYKKLVLNQYFLKLFGVSKFEDIANEMKKPNHEGLDEQNNTNFYHFIINEWKDKLNISKDKLLTYDENIVRHTSKITEKREQKITWKYFQYLSLLFTEIYLDKYINETDEFIKELNEYVKEFNQDKQKTDQIEYYEKEDLKKLAFWNATGSGKTLLMHVNILQYLYNMKQSEREQEINKIILLTPNEGLSNQHLEEFKQSSLNAELFDKNVGPLYSTLSKSIEIIDINKLKDEDGDKTVAVDSFESNNLVLVDEGHRGSTGVEWKEKRDKLCEQGFSFEYSATFGQAMKASGKKELIQEYAKCIIFDYSYRFFYEDGYGKDYNILNLESDEDIDIRNLYLTACLLTFYQQKKLYEDKTKEFKSFMIENPLFVFVGGSVNANAVRTEKGKATSDVVDILIFFKEFTKDKKKSIEFIERLLSGKAGLLDNSGKEIFKDSYKYLASKSVNSTELYRDIINTVFNCDNTDAELHLENLKGASGEIGIKMGQNDYFGVINVGDDAKLLKLCEENDINTSVREFSESLFENINDDDSPVNILIGSKKFTEGWNSWRVSTMGLMNMAKNEGSQVIQLFGRGVRLKGKDFCLKRSQTLKKEDNSIKVPKFIEIIETLNVFGVRANYMAQFKEYLEEEGIPTDNKPEVIEMPIIRNPLTKIKRLKTLKVKKGLDYKKQGTRPVLSLLNEGKIENKIILDWYPKIQVSSSSKSSGSNISPNKGELKSEHLSFINMDEVYFELQKYKNEKSWYNLNINKENLYDILLNPNWYILYIPEYEMEFKDFDNFKKWQNISITLLKKYCEYYYKYKKAEWESPHLCYLDMTEDDDNFIKDDKYTITIREPQDNESLITKIKQLGKNIDEIKKSGKVVEWDKFRCLHGEFEAIEFDKHLYNPLLHINGTKSDISISPDSLNKGEKDFIQDLKRFHESQKTFFEGKELYLLRNKSKSGIGFFEANNFYPDFIMWLIYKEKQYITFVDPKGLRNLKGKNDSKIQLCKKIKEIEEQLKGQNDSIILNSYIISVTPYMEIEHWGSSKRELQELNVLFQSEDKDNYINMLFGGILGISK